MPIEKGFYDSSNDGNDVLTRPDSKLDKNKEKQDIQKYTKEMLKHEGKDFWDKWFYMVEHPEEFENNGPVLKSVVSVSSVVGEDNEVSRDELERKKFWKEWLAKVDDFGNFKKKEGQRLGVVLAESSSVVLSKPELDLDNVNWSRVEKLDKNDLRTYIRANKEDWLPNLRLKINDVYHVSFPHKCVEKAVRIVDLVEEGVNLVGTIVTRKNGDEKVVIKSVKKGRALDENGDYVPIYDGDTFKLG